MSVAVMTLDVTDWPFYLIRQWCHENKWHKGFRINKRLSGDHKIIIQRIA